MYSTDSEELITDESHLVFENDDIEVSYDLWNHGGTSGFYIFNKTDSTLYIDRSKSHLVINGSAETYFQGLITTESMSAKTASTQHYYSPLYGPVSKSESISGSSSVMRAEAKVVVIPPMAGKAFSGLRLIFEPHSDCDIDMFPKRKEVPSKKFTRASTPYEYRNVIAYSFDENASKPVNLVQNSFWVSEIANFSERDFVDHINPEHCGEKSFEKVQVFPKTHPSRWYMKYDKAP